MTPNLRHFMLCTLISGTSLPLGCTENSSTDGDALSDTDANTGGDTDATPDTDTAPISCTQASECELNICHEGFCLSPTGDEDGDGLSNQLEVSIGSDPLSEDSDGDTLLDGLEFGEGTTPVDSDGDGMADLLESALEDSDQDCIPNQFDPKDSEVASSQEILENPLTSSRCSSQGVCADGGLMAICTDGRITCDYSGVADYVFEGVCGSGDKDHNCNGLPDDEDYHCRDDDADGIANGVDNCPEVANPAQTDLDENGLGDHCDMPSFTISLDKESGWIEPEEEVLVSGRAPKFHTIYLYPNADCQLPASHALTVDADGNFSGPVRFAETPSDPPSLSAAVSNGILSHCLLLEEQWVVIPPQFRLPDMVLNTARLLEYEPEGPSGTTAITLRPSDPYAYWKHNSTLHLSDNPDCKGQSHKGLALERVVDGDFWYLKTTVHWGGAPEDATEYLRNFPYFYMKAPDGTRSECLEGAPFYRAPFQVRVLNLVGQEARVVVLGPKGKVLEERGSSSSPMYFDIPLGAGLGVELIGGRFADAPSIGTVAHLHTIWDIVPHPHANTSVVTTLKDITYHRIALPFSQNTPLPREPTRFQVASACGAAAPFSTPIDSTNKAWSHIYAHCLTVGLDLPITIYQRSSNGLLTSFQEATLPNPHANNVFTVPSQVEWAPWTPLSNNQLVNLMVPTVPALEAGATIHAMGWRVNTETDDGLIGHRVNSTLFQVPSVLSDQLGLFVDLPTSRGKIRHVATRKRALPTESNNFYFSPHPQGNYTFPKVEGANLTVANSRIPLDMTIETGTNNFPFAYRGLSDLQGSLGGVKVRWTQSWALEQGGSPDFSEFEPIGNHVYLDRPWDAISQSKLEILGASTFVPYWETLKDGLHKVAPSFGTFSERLWMELTQSH